MAEKGWIKLHRKITENWVYEKQDMFFYWIDILLMVNHKDRKVPIYKKLVVIHAGQTLTSLRKLSARWKIDKNTVGTVLETFRNDGMITFEHKYNGTVITVLNYVEYQGIGKRFSDTDSYTDSDTFSDTLSDTDSYTVPYTNSDTDSTLTRMDKNDYKNDYKNEQEQKKASPLLAPGGYEYE